MTTVISGVVSGPGVQFSTSMHFETLQVLGGALLESINDTAVFANHGEFTLYNSGTISGAKDGIEIQGYNATVYNYSDGIIESTSTSHLDAAVHFALTIYSASPFLSNQGLIRAEGAVGIRVHLPEAHLQNYGSIEAGSGVRFEASAGGQSKLYNFGSITAFGNPSAGADPTYGHGVYANVAGTYVLNDAEATILALNGGAAVYYDTFAEGAFLRNKGSIISDQGVAIDASAVQGPAGVQVISQAGSLVQGGGGAAVLGSMGADDFDLNGTTIGDIHLGDGDDALSANGGASVLGDIFGGAGDDTIYVVTSDALRVEGGTGNDSITLSNGNDTVFGEDGNDTIYTGFGDDEVYGGIGNDNITGWNGNDTLYGGEGNDTIDGSIGDDTIYGGAGDDTLLAGSFGGSNLVYGGEGNDTLTSGNDNDQLYGGIGNDTLYADGFYTSTLNGDSGDDTLIASGPGFGHVLNGGFGNDTLEGSGQDDSLFGGFGDDTLTGGDGNDLMDGGKDSDTLSGGLGDDTIYGGGERDVLEGGDGDDVFVFISISDSDASTGPGDAILDFTRGEDQIDLSAFGASFIGTSGFSGGGAAEVRYVDSGDRAFVFIDVDGDGTRDMRLVVLGENTLDAADFIL